jgi:AcrR family transcriptional regulator
VVGSSSTPDRLMDAAMRLFAEHGFKATSVGAIEKAAGMAPRSGALYQHFKGKQQLLEAAVDRELAGMDELAHAIAMFPLGDLRAELTMLARWNLASLERRAALTRFVRREADLLPKRLRTKLYDRLVARPYAEIVAWLSARFHEAGIDPPDLDALTLILIESMGAYRELNRVFGQVPADIDDDHFIAAWVDTALAVAHRYGLN